MAAVCWGETSCAAGAMGPDSGMLTYSQHPDSTRLRRKTQRRETRCLKYGERSRVSSVRGYRTITTICGPSSCSIKTWFAVVRAEELECHAQNPDLNPAEHLTSILDVTNALEDGKTPQPCSKT